MERKHGSRPAYVSAVNSLAPKNDLLDRSSLYRRMRRQGRRRPSRLSVVRRLSSSRLRAAAAVLALGTVPVLVAAHRAAEARVPARGVVTGSYVAVLANGQKLPWTTQVPAVKGLVHWARLDLAVLRLNADGRYTLSYRYAQEVVDTKAQLQMPPARDEISVGRYSDRGRTLTFVPKQSPGKAARTVTAQVVGADIFLDKTVFVGERPFRVRLLFRRDPSLW
jgi:hypothetical protein